MNVRREAAALVVDLDGECETEALGGALAGVMAADTVVGLVGPLGAGKTRLSRAIAESLGVDPAAIASPTFVLIHEYEGDVPVFHFDAYRLPGADAFEDLGPADYWSAGGVCLVEWADLVTGSMPPDAWWIHIEPRGASRRSIRIEAPGETLDRLAGAIEREG
jgi:tRNA threonylcarbamoyladenosine biosynthesis protein TsaE